MAQVRVYVTLKPTLLDAQGRAVQSGLKALGYDSVQQVRVGKYIEMEIAGDQAAVDREVREMCDRLLANPVIENYRYEVLE